VNLFAAQLNLFRFNSLLCQFRQNRIYEHRRVAVLPWTSVDCNDFHFYSSRTYNILGWYFPLSWRCYFISFAMEREYYVIPAGSIILIELIIYFAVNFLPKTFH
jgi:hypothetical protein